MIKGLRKKDFFSLLLILSILFFIVSCGGGGSSGGGGGDQTIKATVSGKVLDSNGNPVAGALVTVTSIPVTTHTDSNGDFSAQVEIGDHTITVTFGNSTVYIGNFSVSDTSPVNLGDLTPTTPFFAMNNADLNGTYFYGSVHLVETQGRAMAMEADCNGIGTITTTIIADSQGETGGESISYSVIADGTLNADNPEPGDEVTGQISTNGELLSCVDTNSLNHHIYMGFAEKRSSGMTNNDLNGTYIISQIGFDSGQYIEHGRCNFDGAGGAECTLLSGGPVNEFGYSVADDGTFTIVGQADVGQLSQDGDVLLNILATPGGEVLMAIGIRQTSGFSTADTAGSFHGVAMGHDEEENYTVRFELTVDNEGNATFDVLDGSISDLPPQTSDVFSVDSNGGIVLTNNEDMIGQISPDGNLIVLSDADDSDGENLMLIGIRKP